MDFSDKARRENPYAKANPISKIFFLWLLPLFREGYKRDLNLDDMFDPLSDDTSKNLGDQLEGEWIKQIEMSKMKGNKKPSLLKALWAVLGWKYLSLYIGFGFSELCFRVVQPLVLRELLLTFGDSSRKTEKYFLAAAVSFVTFAITVSFHPTVNYAYMLSMRCRIACSSLLYRKTLRLSKSAQGQTTVGQITNLLSNDSNRFDLNLFFTCFIPTGILQMAIFSIFLWREFGVACLTGIAIILALIPIQYWNGKWSAKCRLQIAQRTDERGRILNEIIVGMKIIKQYAWEKPFSAVIKKLREHEVEALKKRLHLRGFYLSMYMSTLKLVIFLTVMTYVLQGNAPTADKVFFLASAYFTIIQSVIYMIPSAISGIGEMKVSINRLENFLLLDEKSDQKIDLAAQNAIEAKSANSQAPYVLLDSVAATWTGENMHLNNITFKAEGDKIVVIVGAVGAGKSSLLHLILGELPVSQGKYLRHGQIAYASQEAWVFAGNVRQNILFGREFNEEKYNRVVKAASLEDDFRQLEFGDQTIVGERGVSLSGGQKARVNLARCLYQEADIYLMDDPLSAVDTRVSRHIFEKCIKDHLKDHLRILCTHQLQYLPQADHIVVLSNGTVAAQGTYGELVDAGVDFVNLMTGDDDETPSRKSSVASNSERVPEIYMNEEFDQEELDQRKDNRLEKKASGALNSGIYWEYLKTANSPATFIVVLSFFVLCQLSLTLSDYWLSYWTSAEANNMQGNDEKYLGRDVYIYVFTGLVTGVIIFNLLRAVGFFTYCTKISVNMHNRMFSSMVRAPSKFFDDNPSGRIINRFMKDLAGNMDDLLPPTFFDMILVFSNVAGVFVLIIISNYYAIVPTVIVLVILATIQRYYVATARDVKRIEGVSKSPIFTHTAASFQGLTTIRSAKAEAILISQFDRLQDIHTTSWFVFFSTARCFGVWVEMICVIFLAIVTFSFLLLQDSSDSGNLGLAITSAMSITGWLQFGMRQSAEVENLMTSVERNVEYANLPSEAPLEIADKKPPEDWPSAGSIRFINVYLAYEEKDVLKNVSFDIKPREKIGIVGRTGAGKSTILVSLFRINEPRGDIFIDGVNIMEIGLHDLRKKISIIPQDPVLFSGTVRYNLDPFHQYEDADIWKVLEEVQLKEAVPAPDFHVSDGGSNFSLGQRQLICLARAILRKNKIIVMDEATASVDHWTDNFIQQTIRTKFADCSIITVAHRLHSVIDCDRILVLDNGYLKEYGHPHILLQDPNGIFTAMVQHTGKSSSALLRKLADQTFHKRSRSFQEDDALSLLSN